MVYKGSCHCGDIKFEVEGDIDAAISCNCSICQKKGSLLWMVPRNQLKLVSSESELKPYTFNSHKIKHQFCTNCGMHPFCDAVDPEGNAVAAVNIRCLDNVNLDKVEVKEFDGRSL
ncbi:GFA family protein [Kangiella shandongensis]|uniref:GFA family protein n=1 Tax=Kangiella shandongensis TaxID=2763258 RepID=UPI001CBBDFEB|nr:GFA family protein [Kangiella shandongensis]